MSPAVGEGVLSEAWRDGDCILPDAESLSLFAPAGVGSSLVKVYAGIV